ncbi:conserved hypothetical protein [Mesorhizobium prunaredense]|uniref:Uncharacterized protein n=1 Tax=Mesorhizobium prunaredense TaxID=1631249 RepID=A0A1R3VKV5_9HYPH|nr:conserved hypothetical protein [Mesorhizobium prunaredense]
MSIVQGPRRIRASAHSMVVDDLHIFGASISPSEADAPLVVDTDRMLPSSTPFQGFKVVSGWRSKVIQLGGIGDSTKTTFATGNEIGWKTLRRLPLGNRFHRLAFERNDQFPPSSRIIH